MRDNQNEIANAQSCLIQGISKFISKTLVTMPIQITIMTELRTE